MTYRLLRDPVGSWYYSETPALLHLWKQIFWSGGVFGGVFKNQSLRYHQKKPNSSSSEKGIGLVG